MDVDLCEQLGPPCEPIIGMISQEALQPPAALSEPSGDFVDGEILSHSAEMNAPSSMPQSPNSADRKGSLKKKRLAVCRAAQDARSSLPRSRPSPPVQLAPRSGRLKGLTERRGPAERLACTKGPPAPSKRRA